MPKMIWALQLAEKLSAGSARLNRLRKNALYQGTALAVPHEP
jgi:hypothetical protein